MFLPLALASFGLLCSIAGIFFVRAVSAMAPALALRLGTFAAAGLFILVSYFVVDWIDVTNAVWWAVVAGSIGGILIGLVTEYYTGGPPVKHLAASSKTGTATVIIAGYSLGLQSVFIPVVAIAIIILIASQLAGLYGVGIAAVGMLATVGFTMAIDGFGPIADNSGGIAEMGGMGKETRKITDSLDELGNTTAAIGKGFAIGAAALAALTIIAAYIQTMMVRFPDFELSLGDPKVIMGMLIGGTIPFLVAAITMNAVGDAAFAMIEEIRRQFREIPGLLEGKPGVKPDPAKCVDIATTAALKKMILPGAIALGTPVLIGFVFGPVVLGGALSGALLATVLLALKMANSGGAWDNAKKYIEKGNYGGKGSENHAATVVGDTVGDPLKDTSGPLAQHPDQAHGHRQPDDRPAARRVCESDARRTFGCGAPAMVGRTLPSGPAAVWMRRRSCLWSAGGGAGRHDDVRVPFPARWGTQCVGFVPGEPLVAADDVRKAVIFV
jgi:K(+)-stimulated pyrophosphate-energized sodium pump